MTPIEVRHIANETDEQLWAIASSGEAKDIGVLELLSPSGSKILISRYIFGASTSSRATQWPEYRETIKSIKQLNLSLANFKLRFTHTVQPESVQLTPKNRDFTHIAPYDFIFGTQIRKHLNRNPILRALDFEIVAVARLPDSPSDAFGKSRWQLAAREAGMTQTQYESWAFLFPHRK